MVHVLAFFGFREGECELAEIFGGHGATPESGTLA
jgi:hypothetical protein